MPTKPLPNFIIAGVNKGGTTSLFSYLSLHPEICPASQKETCYFLHFRYGETIPPFEKYCQYFRQCPDRKYVMESTPGYFYGGKIVARAIEERLGNIKILIILREPIARLFSFYKYKKSMMELNSDLLFEDYIALCNDFTLEEVRKRENDRYWGIQGGFYANYLEEWFEVFENSIKIVFFEQLKNNSGQLLKEICQWLNIDEHLYDFARLEIENQSVNYKNKILHRAALSFNFRGERFFRANPQIKQIARKIYYAINGRPHEEVVSEKTIADLELIYSSSNRRLAAQLFARGYSNLPDWLDR